MSRLGRAYQCDEGAERIIEEISKIEVESQEKQTTQLPPDLANDMVASAFPAPPTECPQ
jgi:predicted DNA repair protein MutK